MPREPSFLRAKKNTQPESNSYAQESHNVRLVGTVRDGIERAASCNSSSPIPEFAPRPFKNLFKSLQ